MQHGLSRTTVIILISLASLLVIALFALAGYAVVGWAGSTRQTGSAPVRWESLPVPVKSNPQWTSYTYTGHINTVVQTGNLLWAGTDGGLVVWDLDAGGSGGDLDGIPAARFMVEHGLPANRVTALAVGADGAIWAGTRNGLARYDGRAWQTFSTADGLPDDMIRALAVDREGLVWAATPSGLGRYDGKAWDSLTAANLLSPLPAGNPTALAIDRDNRLWMGTDQGLAVYDGRRWSLLTTADGLSENEIIDLVTGSNGELWALTPSAANRFDEPGWQSFSWPVAPEQEGEQLLSPVRAAAVTDNRLVIGGSGWPDGLQQLDVASGMWEPVAVNGGHAPAKSVTALLANDATETLWVGTADGLWRAERAGWARLQSPSDLAGADVADLLLTDDTLWLATAAGVSRFDGQWQHYGAQEGLPAGTRVLDRTPDGTVWAATSDPLDGLSKLAVDQESWTTRVCEVSAPASANVTAAVQAPDGTIWFGTDNGLSHFQSGAWERQTMQDGLPHNVITDLAIDREGTVWAATLNGLAQNRDGVWQTVISGPFEQVTAAPDGDLWAMTAQRLYHVDHDSVKQMPLLLGTAAVRDMTANDDGVWLATSDGVVFFDGDALEFHGDAAGLPSADVTAIMTGQDGAVWAATSGNEQQVEISLFDGRRWHPHPFRSLERELLRSSVILDVLGTPDGDVWLATPAGVERFSNGQWSFFGQESGLPGRTANDLVWAAGTVWAGTDSGLARFNGRGWEPFAAASNDGRGPAVQSLAAAPNGDLWLSLEQGWPNGLRVFNGVNWAMIDLLSDLSFVREIVFEPPSAAWPSGRAVALVEEAGSAYLGIFDASLWTWHRGDALPVVVERLAMSPDGELWLTGMLPDSNGRPDAPGLAVLELTDDGQLVEQAVFRLAEEPDLGLTAVSPTVGSAPVHFGVDGRAYVGVAGKVLVFEAQDERPLQPSAVLEPPLPFSRHTFALGEDSTGRLWVGTERGAAVSLNDNRPGGGSDGWQSYYAPPIAPAWWGSVIAMEPRPDGGVLLGTSAGGIGIYTGRDFDGVLRPSQGPPEWDRRFYPVTSVLSDETGVLWAASAGGGTASFNGNRWFTHAPAETLVAPTNALVVRDDVAWLGTEAGLAMISGLDRDGCLFANVEEGLATKTAMRDEDGSIWIGTVDHGLLHVAGDSFQWDAQWDGAPVPLMAEAVNGDMWFLNGHHTWLTWHSQDKWRRLPLDLQTVRAGEISALDVAPNLGVWVGSQKGVLVFNGRDWKTFTTADGLADNQVDTLAVSMDGSVWLATPGGLSHYTPATATVIP